MSRMLTGFRLPASRPSRAKRGRRGPLTHQMVTTVTPTLAGAALVATGGLAALSTPTAPPMQLVRYASMSDAALNDRAEHDPDYAKALGHRMTRDFGYRGDRQWHCLRRLWRFESSWRVHADNPSSRAYGIPQALPGKKMSSAGDHWRRSAKTQIRWGLRYVRGRYHRPCHALRHEHRHGWY